MTTLRFTVPGPPYGKRPPQFVPALGRTLKSSATRAYEKRVADIVRATYRGDPLDEAIEVSILAVKHRPKSRPACVSAAAWKAGGRLSCPTKPDPDNVAKSILDGMKIGGALRDDQYVTTLTVRKVYAAVGEGPHVAVVVTLAEAA